LSIKKDIYKVLLIILFGFISSVEATDIYWAATNDGTEKDWHLSENWSLQDGTNTNAPGGNDSAIFNSSYSNAKVKLEGDVDKIWKLKVNNGYSGTINLNGHN
jgi:hypothetical protein